jgi:hypothetical protein
VEEIYCPKLKEVLGGYERSEDYDEKDKGAFASCCKLEKLEAPLLTTFG